MNEVRQGLYLMGFNVDLVDWVLNSNMNVIGGLNEARRTGRLYGKNQQEVQSHVSEAYSPVRVAGMADDGSDYWTSYGLNYLRRIWQFFGL